MSDHPKDQAHGATVRLLDDPAATRPLYTAGNVGPSADRSRSTQTRFSTRPKRLDSAIEGLASVIVLWRFTGTRTISPLPERQAQKWVAITFYMLAPYVAAEAIETLIEGTAAETSWLGIALTAGTLVLCPWLGIAKQRIGAKLESRATYGEGTQNVLCAILAGAVLVGLAANSLFRLWWLDPAVAPLIASICVREGHKAWQGEQCGCAICA